jgi:hypothetical protein
MFRAKGGQNVNAMNQTALDLMGQWLDAIAADRSDKPLPEKVIADKPAGASDACWIGGQRVDGVAQIGANNQCVTTYPPHSLPANVAGKPLDSIAAKCQLEPISDADYPGFGPNQLNRLRTIFPDGVCDWSKPGVNEAPVDGTWKQFGPKRTAKPRKQRLKLNVRRRGIGKVVLAAQLKPCPATTWQRVSFEQRKRGKWRRFDTDLASGKRCRATATLKVRDSAKVRATVKRSDAFKGAKSAGKRVQAAR